MIDLGFFDDNFLGDLIIMIIGLAVLGVGAELLIAGAYVSTVNIFMTILLMIVGIILIGFGGRILLDLIERIQRKNKNA